MARTSRLHPQRSGAFRSSASFEPFSSCAKTLLFSLEKKVCRDNATCKLRGLANFSKLDHIKLRSSLGCKQIAVRCNATENYHKKARRLASFHDAVVDLCDLSSHAISDRGTSTRLATVCQAQHFLPSSADRPVSLSNSQLLARRRYVLKVGCVENVEDCCSSDASGNSNAGFGFDALTARDWHVESCIVEFALIASECDPYTRSVRLDTHSVKLVLEPP